MIFFSNDAHHIFRVAPLRLDLLPLALLAQMIVLDDRPLPEVP